MRKGQLVTAKNWYMPHRVYGRILSRDGRKKGFVVVQGKFGLETFCRSTVRVVKGCDKIKS